VDDRRFDELSRRVGALALPRLPRRGVLGFLGIASLAGTLGVALEPQPAAAAKCKKEGKKCDKKKCKKKDKKCCCKDLKCKNGRCEEKGGSCRTDADLLDEWTSFGSTPGPDDFNSPFGIATDPDGNVYITDTGNTRVLIFNSGGALIDEFGDPGNEDDEFQEPLGIAFGEDNNGNARVYVADPGMTDLDFRLRKFRAAETNNANEGNLGDNELTNPVGVAVDSDGNIWVVDSDDGQVFRYSDNGSLQATFEPDGQGDLSVPQGIGVFEENGQEFVIVADTGNDRIVKFEHVDDSSDGLEFVDAAGSTGTQNDRFNDPVGIAIDSCSNIWVADRLNNRIQQLDKDLNFESRINNSSLNRPTGVALSPNGRRLYVVSRDNERVLEFELS
jgi:tripartite motif-containing protein 71